MTAPPPDPASWIALTKRMCPPLWELTQANICVHRVSANKCLCSLPVFAQALSVMSLFGICSFNLSQTTFFLYVLCHTETGMANQPLLSLLSTWVEQCSSV